MEAWIRRDYTSISTNPGVSGRWTRSISDKTIRKRHEKCYKGKFLQQEIEAEKTEKEVTAVGWYNGETQLHRDFHPFRYCRTSRLNKADNPVLVQYNTEDDAGYSTSYPSQLPWY